MRVDLVGGGNFVGLASTATVYRVRIWGPQPGPGIARALDEWELTDVDDIGSVLDWATSAAAGRDVEIFVVVHSESERYVRVSGIDGDADGGTSVTVVFSEG